MRIVLLGPPGSGKGELVKRLGSECGLEEISMTRVLQNAAAQDSELGRLAREAMAVGRCSDELLAALLRIRMAQDDVAGGFVIVDFPKDSAQANILDDMLDGIGRPLDLVINIDVDPDELMERLVGRIYCDGCGARYNLYVNPPMVEGICDHCGTRVHRRPEDYEETIANRLRIYEGQVGPLQQYYLLHGKLRRVNGDGDIDSLWQAVKKIIDETPPTVIETEPVAEVAEPLNLVSGKPAAKKAAAKKGAPKKAAPEKAAPEKAAPKKAAPKKAAPKKAAPKKAAPKKAAPKKAAPKKAAPKKAAPKKAAPKKAAPKKAAPKKAAPKKAAPKKAAPKKAAPKKAAPKKAAPKKAAPKKAAPKKAAPKKAAPKKAAPKKAAPKKAAPKKAAPKEAAPKKAAPKKAAAKKGAGKK